MTTNTGPPKARKRASKKNKKSWRKNTDIKEIEDFLDDQRLEERLGGAYKDRKDEELFVVDKNEEEPEKSVSVRLSRRKKCQDLNNLKCFQNLKVTAGVKDPKKGRNRRKLPEERSNPIVRAQERARIEAGKWKRTEIEAKKHRIRNKELKKASELERKTRRRTRFDFDLWNDGPTKEALAKKIESNEWIEDNTKIQNLNNTRNLRRKTPNDFHRKTSQLPSVEAPHGGNSYNPSFIDHQDLMWKATIVEINKEKAKDKIEYHTIRMFPTADQVPTEESKLKEMSEGIPALEDEKKQEESEESDKEMEEEEEVEAKQEKPKTRKQRRKERQRNAELHKLQQKKIEKAKNQDLFRLKSIKRTITKYELSKNAKLERRNVRKELRNKFQPLSLSKVKYEDPEVELKLSNELTGNLRTLKPEGNLLLDRYKSLQKRNVIEPALRQKIQKKGHKRKKVEKRNYKMPWEKPDVIKA